MGSAAEIVFARRGEQYYSLKRGSTEPDSQPHLKIAEFATGTAIWLNNVSKLVAPTCKLDGYDISSAQFSPASSLPTNITLRAHDILKPLPEEFHGYYDIIAVRALVTALADEEWEIALANLVQCLKPGGHLQWIDGDMSPSGMKILQPKAMAPRPALDRAMNILQQKWPKLLGRDLHSCTRLGGLLRSHGFENLFNETMSTDWNADAKERTDLTVECMIAFNGLAVKYAQMEGSEINVEEALEVGDNVFRGAQLGKSYLRLDWNIVTGRKPEVLHEKFETNGT